MLDDDPGAIVLPSHLLLLFMSKEIQHALLHKKQVPRILPRSAACFDQCCIPLLIYPVSPSENKNFPPHLRKVLLLMLEKLWRSLWICSWAKFMMLLSILYWQGWRQVFNFGCQFLQNELLHFICSQHITNHQLYYQPVLIPSTSDISPLSCQARPKVRFCHGPWWRMKMKEIYFDEKDWRTRC